MPRELIAIMPGETARKEADQVDLALYAPGVNEYAVVAMIDKYGNTSLTHLDRFSDLNCLGREARWMKGKYTVDVIISKCAIYHNLALKVFMWLAKHLPGTKNSKGVENGPDTTAQAMRKTVSGGVFIRKGRLKELPMLKYAYVACIQTLETIFAEKEVVVSHYRATVTLLSSIMKGDMDKVRSFVTNQWDDGAKRNVYNAIKRAMAFESNPIREYKVSDGSHIKDPQLRIIHAEMFCAFARESRFTDLVFEGKKGWGELDVFYHPSEILRAVITQFISDYHATRDVEMIYGEFMQSYHKNVHQRRMVSCKPAIKRFVEIMPGIGGEERVLGPAEKAPIVSAGEVVRFFN